MLDVISYLFILGVTQYAVLVSAYPLVRRFVAIQHVMVSYISSMGFLLFALLLSIYPCVYRNVFWVYSFDNLTRGTNFIEFNFSFALDSLSLWFAILVTTIGLATNCYTKSYFRGEADEGNFLFWLNAFILSMLILVLAGNFFTVFVGWELIGLTSFFLINFWRTRRGVVKSSFKALVFNVVSDCLLLGSFVCFYLVYSTTNCKTFLSIVITTATPRTTLLWFGTLCLISCAAIKSVQMIGHLWLPDSMEAPVPASSLIHSATLVSAGIYLLCRFNVLLVVTDCISPLITLGSITAAYGGVVAAAQTDMKKLLAYSTMSHCGFLWILASSGNVVVTVVYLYLHGLFKAATFYCAGSFIRAYNTQDTRWMGGGAKFIRLDSFLLVFCGANLAGLPFTIGIAYKVYFFKLILLASVSWWQVGFMFIGMGSSLVYYFRLTNYAIFDFYKGVKLYPNYNLLFTAVKLKSGRLIPANHIIAVSFLIIFAIATSYFFYLGIINNLLMLDSIQEELSTILVESAKLELLYSTYVVFFYTVYYILFLLLCVVVCRPNVFAIESLITLLYFSIFVGFLSLSCEVTLWQKLIR